jgi:hypothetical protein
MSALLDKMILTSLRQASNPVKLDAGYPAAACFKNLSLVEIPEVMERRGLQTGAALMRRWFLAPAFVMPSTWKVVKPSKIKQTTIPAQYIDQGLVKMQWVLRHARALAAYQELTQAVRGLGAATSLAASKDELFTNLQAAGKMKTIPTQFGLGSVLEINETSHMNARSVSDNFLQKLTDPIDDLYVSLGAFTIHAAAGGRVVPIKNAQVGRPTHDVIIDRIGCYIRDVYDFNGDQTLGLWNSFGPHSRPAPGLVHVENSGFRQWRNRFSRGGDFIILSDVWWVGLSKPMIWQFTNLQGAK